MHLRIKLGKFFIQLGRFIESLAVVVMRPADLVEFNRLTYASPSTISAWGEDSTVAAGLSTGEQDLLAHLPIKQGRLLLLGLGGGRDAIALAKMGFEVVGVDLSRLVASRKIPPGLAFHEGSCRKFPNWRSRPPLSTWSFFGPCILHPEGGG
jgi:hypothetical protein